MNKDDKLKLFEEKLDKQSYVSYYLTVQAKRLKNEIRILKTQLEQLKADQADKDDHKEKIIKLEN